MIELNKHEVVVDREEYEHLKTSAEELLEACEAMVEAIEAMPKGWNGTKLFQEDIYKLIAKAKGGV